MGNALAFIAVLAAVLYIGWWLRNRHPADQHANHPKDRS